MLSSVDKGGSLIIADYIKSVASFRFNSIFIKKILIERPSSLNPAVANVPTIYLNLDIFDKYNYRWFFRRLNWFLYLLKLLTELFSWEILLVQFSK